MTELNASAPAEPMSDERLAAIREHQQWCPTDDGGDLLAEVDRLRAMEQRVRKLRAEWKQGAVSARRFRDQADQNRDVPNMLRENAWMTAYTEFGKEIDAALDGTEAGR